MTCELWPGDFLSVRQLQLVSNRKISSDSQVMESMTPYVVPDTIFSSILLAGEIEGIENNVSSVICELINFFLLSFEDCFKKFSIFF